MIGNNIYFNYFWESLTIEKIALFTVGYFFVIWIALILWVVKDIWNRTNSVLYSIFCVLLVIILTPLGVFLYLLIRPSRTVFEKSQEEIDENLAILSSIVEKHALIEETGKSLQCPKCNSEIQADFILCPSCKETLRNNCHSCHREIRENWKVCPYCGEKQK
jgi:RNA polymerase subunit RPABC4/transcription elongation factor Spt4